MTGLGVGAQQREPTGSAVVRNDRVLAVAASVSRLGGCVFLLIALAAGNGRPLAAVALAESAVVVAACWRTGRVRAWWAVADSAFCALLFVLDPPLYNYLLVAVLLIGIAPVRLRWAAVLSTCVALAYIWSELAGPVNPPWNVVPNAVSIAVVPLVVWLIARQIRAIAVSIDGRRADAVRRAEEVATEWERGRQAAQLRARLFELLDELASPAVVADEPLREQIAAEARWLGEFVAGDRPTRQDLREVLLGIAADRGRKGVDVRLDVDPDVPALSAERVEAVAGAVWEALTNVAKHSGVNRATVRVRGDSAGVTVEVADTGRGFDRSVGTSGVGLRRSIGQRLREVGGAAVVESEPGAGTVVRLSIRDDQP